MTGKKKSVSRPEKERLLIFREDLIIIKKDLWEKTRARSQDLNGTWPVNRRKKEFYKQKSYVHTSPSHLFSGIMKCKYCDGAMVLISGKGSGYHGCYNAKRKTCKNGLLVPRARLEQTIITELKERLLTTENLDYVYKNVEKLAASSFNEVPEQVQKKMAQYEKIQAEIQNYLKYLS